ncbi:MAG TPA: PQQ-binding-like beta-propeller repeat protein [Planctomycetaceae bacterium]
MPSFIRGIATPSVGFNPSVEQRALASGAILFASLVVSSAAAIGAPPVWPQFRGANCSGVSPDDRPLPIDFGPGKNCLWKTPLPAGHSSPVVWGDRIFLTGYSAEPAKLETVCINRQTGEIAWRRAAPAEKIEKGHELGNPAASTPAADADRVYVYFGSCGLIAYDHSGNEQWKVALPIPGTRFGTATSPVLVEGRLILNQQGDSTRAFDVTTGGQLWQTEKLPFRPDYSLPVMRKVGGVTELIIQGTAGMSGIDSRDGSLRWQAGGFTFQPIPTPVLAGDLLYVVSFHPIGRSEDRIQLKFDELLEKYDKNGDKKLGEDEVPEKLALVSRGDPNGTGDMTFKQMWFMLDSNRDKAIDGVEWTKVDLFTAAVNNSLLAFRAGADGNFTNAGIAWKVERALPESPSPLLYRGRLYTVKNGGIVSCYSAADGKLHFQKRIEADGSYYASPVAGDGKIFTASMNGVVAVLAAENELRVLSRNDLGEALMATPAILDGRLYVRTAGHLYAFGSP